MKYIYYIISIIAIIVYGMLLLGDKDSTKALCIKYLIFIVSTIIIVGVDININHNKVERRKVFYNEFLKADPKWTMDKELLITEKYFIVKTGSYKEKIEINESINLIEGEKNLYINLKRKSIFSSELVPSIIILIASFNGLDEREEFYKIMNKLNIRCIRVN